MNTNKSISIKITQETVKRLLHDLKYIQRNPLHEHGIYYIHDEVDMMIGYALIIGTENTPYYGGNYLFKFSFPYNYPYSPPTVTFCTNQDKIRFNPNLYINGKVCISILNTWAGDQWTSCQTISTILLSLCTLLCKNPFLNEPSTSLTQDEELVKLYNEIIEYENINITICNILQKDKNIYLPFFDLFYPIIAENFLHKYNYFTEFCKTKHIENDQQIVLKKMNSSYRLQVWVNYEQLTQKLQNCFSLLQENNCEK